MSSSVGFITELRRKPLTREEEEEAIVATVSAAHDAVGEASARLASRNVPVAAGGVATMLNLREKQCWRRFSLLLSVCAAVFVLAVVVMWRQTIAAARDPATGRIRAHTFPYFVLCFVGGGVTGLAHVFVTPIDVVKCRMQVGACGSMTEGFRSIFADAKGSCVRAMPMLFRGWVPATYAYVTQGALKFFFYELFKYASSLVWWTGAAVAAGGGGGSSSGGMRQLASYLISSAVAEVVADIGLAPFETIKVKLQTTSAYPTDMASIMPRIWAAEGWHGFYKGLGPLWLRQVPYTMVKFASFEKIAQGLHAVLLSRATPDTPPSAAAQLVVTLLAGCIAGVLCGLVSHPADTLVSKLSQRGGATTKPEAALLPHARIIAAAAAKVDADDESLDRETKRAEAESALRSEEVAVAMKSVLHGSGTGSSMMDLARELGWKGLWRGLLPRLAMVSSITSMQWLMYDAFRVSVGLPTTGSAGGGGAAAAPAK